MNQEIPLTEAERWDQDTLTYAREWAHGVVSRTQTELFQQHPEVTQFYLVAVILHRENVSVLVEGRRPSRKAMSKAIIQKLIDSEYIPSLPNREILRAITSKVLRQQSSYFQDWKRFEELKPGRALRF